METKWLEDFVSLAETRSFSRSAQLRHVTQPAFSRRIQALEAERVIRRARESALHDERDKRTDGEWDGNVYRPKSFEKPKKPH